MTAPEAVETGAGTPPPPPPPARRPWEVEVKRLPVPLAFYIGAALTAVGVVLMLLAARPRAG